MWSTFKYITSVLLLVASFTSHAQDEADDETPTKPKVEMKGRHQLCIGFDLVQPIQNYLSKNRTAYELSADYYCGKEVYAVLEGGWGNATVAYTDLAYKSNNTFFKLGINKSILLRLSKTDWDMGFIGIRYGFAAISRGQGTYTLTDNFYGTTSTGIIPAKSLTAHWAELVGGMRLELIKGFCIGWTIRGQFLLSQGALKDLSPAYIAGYGKGDKTSNFGYNFFLTYAIRWNKKEVPQDTKPDMPLPPVAAPADTTKPLK